MNQITLPVAELKPALAGLSKVVNRRATLPVLHSLKLSRNAEGKVSLSATDLDAFVSYQVESLQPGEVVDVLVPFDQLKNAAQGSATADVVVLPESKLKARLRYQVGNSPVEQAVATIAAEEFPPSPKITQPAVKLPANFGETLRQAFVTSSTDSTRLVLNGAYLDVAEPKCHTIVSTNGRSLFAANTFQFDLQQSVNLARHKFLAWSGFLEGECELAVQPNKSSAGWVQLATPRWTCIVKQIDGQFPKWRQVIPQDTEAWTRLQLSEAARAQMLNLSTKLPGDDTENRMLQLRVDQEVHLEGRNKDDKEFTRAVIGDVKITGQPVLTALNREYLQHALACGLDEIRIHNELEPILFCRPGKRMIVMPVRLTGPPTPTPQPTTPTPTPEKPVQERKPEMPKTTVKSETTQPEAPSPTVSLVEQVETLKETLKTVIRELSTIVEAVKQTEKQNRASEKEVEMARATLKKLQQVTI